MHSLSSEMHKLKAEFKIIYQQNLSSDGNGSKNSRMLKIAARIPASGVAMYLLECIVHSSV